MIAMAKCLVLSSIMNEIDSLASWLALKRSIPTVFSLTRCTAHRSNIFHSALKSISVLCCTIESMQLAFFLPSSFRLNPRFNNANISSQSSLPFPSVLLIRVRSPFVRRDLSSHLQLGASPRSLFKQWRKDNRDVTQGRRQRRGRD